MAYHSTFQPLKVTAHLRTGIVADRWLPLDALIWYQAHRAQLGPQVATLPGGQTQDHKVSIPLKVNHPGEDNWYFACSWAHPQPWWAAEGTDHWNKRIDSQMIDLIDFAGRRGKVIIEQGKYKAYHMPIFYRVAERIEWYCFGDKEEIEALLCTMTHIGKKAAQGWGRVVRWVVEPWVEDWSVWRDGHLTRGVPEQDMLELIRQNEQFAPFDVMNYGLRPSYYRHSNQRRLAIPG